MGLPNEVNSALIGAAAAGGYEIEQSLRFDGSSYLSRTPSSSGTTTTWTFSCWLKLASTSEGCPISAATSGGYTALFYSVGGEAHFRLSQYVSANQFAKSTTARYRDPGAWYHLVTVYDSTNAIASDRIRYYINGVRVTNFSNDGSSITNVDPSSGRTSGINANVAQRIGSQYDGTYAYLKGYMAEAHMLDGTAVTDAEDFGEYDKNGVWLPIEVSGVTYGTNGWYMKFDPTATNGIGHDHSGNGNNFTPTGFTTSGTGTDVMSDTPTTNWATLNPVEKSSTWNAYGTGMSNGNLEYGTSSSWNTFVSTIGISSGKWYFELDVTGNSQAGFVAANWAGTTGVALADTGALGYNRNDGKIYENNNAGTSYGNTFTGTHTLGIAVDADNDKFYFAIDNTWQNSANPSSGTGGYSITMGSKPWRLAASAYQCTGQVANFGQRDFSYTPPTGFKALNTSNLSAPAIKDGDEYFSTYLGPGQGMLDTSSRITADPGNLSNSYFLGSNIDDPGYFNKGGPNASLGNRAIYGTTSSGFENNGVVGGSNTPTYNNGYIEFATALTLSGNCYVYWGNTSAGNGSELGAAIRVTYGDGTTATSQLGKTIDYPSGSWTVGNFTFDKRYIGRFSLNNTKTLKKVEISSGMAARYAAHIAAIVIDDDPEIDLGTLTISVEDGSKFTVGDDVYKSTDSFISGTVTAVSGNNVTIRTSEGFIDDTDRNIDWSENWPDAELVHRDSATQITDTDYELVWIKDRDNSNDHQLLDRVRGTNKVLESNTTDIERTYSAPSGYSVAWAWRTGAGSGSSNTAGSITSTVSANSTAGFSIVTYTGTGSAATVGHGLGVPPAFMMIKSSNKTFGWTIYHQSLGNTRHLEFSTGTGYTGDAWNSTNPTSTVFSIGTDAGSNNGSIPPNNYVAYCFAEVEGYSKFGSYTGNGNADGPFVYTGHRVGWLMIKNVSANSEWSIIDAARDPYNRGENYLSASSTGAEASGFFRDNLSNGFKIRDNGSGVNTNGNTYIFMSFAENPFGGEGVSPATAR